MFSVAMATYNGSRYLHEQLQSIAEQTTLPDEVVICDDGSTDSTTTIALRFAAIAPFPVRFTRNETRLGYADNFMKAAGLCKSDYIAFCDQDDVWLPEKLSVAKQHILTTGCTLFQHGFRLVDYRGDLIPWEGAYYGPLGKGRWAIGRGMSQIFHRSVLSFENLRGISVDHCTGNNVMTHDQWILFVNSLIGNVVTVKDVLLHYRQHGSNVFGFTNHNHKIPFAQKRSYLHSTISRYMAGAQSRAAIIESLIDYCPKEKSDILKVERNYYLGLAHYEKSRLSLYTDLSRISRITKAARLHTDRAYRAFGRRGLRDSGLDILYGVLSG